MLLLEITNLIIHHIKGLNKKYLQISKHRFIINLVEKGINQIEKDFAEITKMHEEQSAAKKKPPVKIDLSAGALGQNTCIDN